MMHTLRAITFSELQSKLIVDRLLGTSTNSEIHYIFVIIHINV